MFSSIYSTDYANESNLTEMTRMRNLPLSRLERLKGILDELQGKLEKLAALRHALLIHARM